MNPGSVPAGRVVLRPWEPEEARLYLDLRDDLVFRFTTEDPMLDEVTARSNLVSAQSNPNLAPFAVCRPGGGPVGSMAVTRLGKKAVLSYWLSAEARGRGWATDALAAASDWAGQAWEVDLLELEIDLENLASRAVAEAAGYHRHGLRLESACGGPALLYHRQV